MASGNATFEWMPSKQKLRHAPEAIAAPVTGGGSLSVFLERRGPALVLGLVLVASLRIAATYTVFSHTFDEPVHIAPGMEWLDKGTYTSGSEHPPLARVAAAIGPYLLGVRSQGKAEPGEEALAILQKDHHYDLTLAAARAGILPFFWVGCAVVYWGSRRCHGATVATIAVFLFTFLPPVLGHAGLATTDMALAAWLSAAFFGGLLWAERPILANAAWFGAGTGLAVVSKYSTLLFLPVCLAVALAWHCAIERPAPRRLAAAAKERVPTFTLAVGVALVVVWAAFRFSFGKVDFVSFRLPAPELFRGIETLLQHNAGGHGSYLLGQRSATGFWYFYPVALAVKTPLAFLGLLGFGIVLAVRDQGRFRRAWPALAFAAGILLVGLFSRINIGVRHILPVYAGFSILAALGVARMLDLMATRPWIKPVLAALLVWFAASSLISHPDYLPYFNMLAANEPEKILVDSDLDWGQDMKRLGKRLQESGARQVVFNPFPYPQSLLTDFGFPEALLGYADAPSPGWNAVGLTDLKSNRLGLGDSHPELPLWPNQIKPTARIGKSILLWYFPTGRGLR